MLTYMMILIPPRVSHSTGNGDEKIKTVRVGRSECVTTVASAVVPERLGKFLAMI